MKNSALALLVVIACSFTFSPLLVLAEENDSNIDAEVIAELLEQVRILSLEVLKLQKSLESVMNPSLNYEPLSDSEIRDTIDGSVKWFKLAQEESGRFRYEYLAYENRYLPLDNVVRQAGGLYALGEVAIHDPENKYDLKSTLQKSINYFDSLTNEGAWNGYNFKCIGNSRYNEMCQLGATSLALVGVIDTVTRYPELKDTYDELIHNYGRYLLAMKKEGSGFRHAYVSSSEPSPDESSFSNGEALLGLVRYYMYSPSEETKNVILDSFEYFNSDEVIFDFPLYLWAMAGLKDMQQLWPNQEFVDYVLEYTDWRISGFAYRKWSNHNMCAYVEGLVSAHSVLEGNVNEIKLESIENEINYWLRHSKNLQISNDDEYRILTNDSGEYYFGKIEDLNRAVGGFLTGKDELTQRIDFTQHCVNSYLQEVVDIRKKSL